jgi:cell division protein FtsI (penicillin-binding protein 3)
MATTSARIGFLQFVFLGGLAAVVGRAVQLQVVEGRQWAAVAESTRTRTRQLEARRGTIYDRHGSPLAVSQEFYRVGVATWEVPKAERERVAWLLINRVGKRAAEVRAGFRAPERDRKYLFHNPLASASDIEELRRFKGVYPVRVYRRSYPSGGLARELIGAVNDSARGRTGLERSLDSLLTGVAGEATFLRDRFGNLYESPDRIVRLPVAGHDVLLTLDTELQGIAEAAVAEAVDANRADAGDVVILEPASGEVLAMATIVRRTTAATKAGAWVPAEPGSTIKPFAAAGLIQLGRDGGRVPGMNGVLPVPGRARPVRDDHPIPGDMDLALAIEKSSNVGVYQFTSRLSFAEHYELLRDFGFGVPTGIEIPGESPGLLRKPHRWQPGNTQPSMAQGYEIEITPLQLAAAYAALANGGELPSLTLVREIRDPEGRVIYRHVPHRVRQVVSPEAADKVRGFLAAAASTEGTGGRAQLDRFTVIGKTGTARNVVNGRYTNTYTSSFAGIFPADRPQLVVVIRVSNPTAGDYYGGLVAAPVNRQMIQQALVARSTAIDRSRFSEAAPVEAGGGPPRAQEPAAPETVPVPVPARMAREETPGLAEIPPVTGLSVRQAALLLHRRGFRVAASGGGRVNGSRPAAGDSVPAGSVVHLLSGGGASLPAGPGPGAARKGARD